MLSIRRTTLKKKILSSFLLADLGLFVLFPASSNYMLRDYEFGGGGGAASSTNYSQQGVLGEQTTNDAASSNYKILGGLQGVQQSNVPTVTLSNDANWYNKLKLVIGTQNNPTDTVYAVAISSDSFVTTQYVQSDGTVGSTLGDEDYQSYTGWGSGTGSMIIGLTPGTTYQIKVKARQGQYTESPFGPVATASTSDSTVSFDIDVSSSNSETSSPYSLALGSLTAGSITTSNNKVWVDFDTNAEGGGYVYVAGAYGGLKSSNLNYTISSGSVDLSSVNEGYGLQSSSTTATTGSLTALAPYNNSSQNVGVIDSTIREVYDTGGAPVTAGRASFVIKAKAGSTTPSSNDYTDTLTLIASGSF